MSLLKNMAYGAGAGVAQAGVSYGLGMLGSAQQQKYLERNQRRAFAMQQNEELLRARNNVAGLKLAGLSPALASDGKFSPGSAPSSPLGSMNYPSVDLSTSALQLAEAKKAEAEADSIDIDNQNKLDSNLTSEVSLKQFFTSRADRARADGNGELAAWYDEQADKAGSFGALTALHNFYKMADDETLWELHDAESQLGRKVINTQLSSGIWKDIAKAPRTERLQAIKFMREMESRIRNLDADTLNKGKDLELTKEQIEQIKIINKRYENSDLNTMVAEGRWSDAAKYILSNALGSLASEGVETAKEVGLKKMPVKVQHVE